MKIIKGFEGENLEVSDFGEWVGNDYIDYKSEYESNQKIIDIMFEKIQILNKQLDKDDALIKKISCSIADLKKHYKSQREEFIEYMNKTIEELECTDVDDEEMKGYLIQRIDTFKEILSKYKEFIGVKDE